MKTQPLGGDAAAAVGARRCGDTRAGGSARGCARACCKVSLSMRRDEFKEQSKNIDISQTGSF